MYTKSSTTPPALIYPVHGCKALAPMTKEEVEKLDANSRKTIRAHWKNEGVRALVQLLEREVGTKQARACLPGATLHDAGQGYALQQLLAKINGIGC